LLELAHFCLGLKTTVFVESCKNLIKESKHTSPSCFRRHCNVLGRNSSPWGWWNTGTGCPEKLWLPPPWKCPRPGWMELWATWSSEGCPFSWQGAWN